MIILEGQFWFYLDLLVYKLSYLIYRNDIWICFNGADFDGTEAWYLHQSFGSCGLDSFVLFSSVGSSWGKSISVSVSMIRFVPMVVVCIFWCLSNLLIYWFILLCLSWKRDSINQIGNTKVCKKSLMSSLSLSHSHAHILEHRALFRNARLSNLMRFQRFWDFLVEQLMQKAENVSESHQARNLSWDSTQDDYSHLW